MIAEYEKRIAIRIAKKQRHEIDELVKSGAFKNLSQVIRTALNEFFCNG